MGGGQAAVLHYPTLRRGTRAVRRFSSAEDSLFNTFPAPVIEEHKGQARSVFKQRQTIIFGEATAEWGPVT